MDPTTPTSGTTHRREEPVNSPPVPTNTIPPLTGAHLRTYQSIFEHPVWHNLCWHEVHALFRHLGQVETQPDGNLRVTRHGEELILHPPRTPDVATTDELMTLRLFLIRSEPAPSVPGAEAPDHLELRPTKEQFLAKAHELQTTGPGLHR